MDITNHIIQIDFVDGYEYLDKIGNVMRYFSENNPNINFHLDNATQTLVLHEPTKNIDTCYINKNNIRVVASNGLVIENAAYIQEKTFNIAKKINVSNYKRIGIRYQITIKEQNLKEKIKKLFTIGNVKYFTLTYDELEISENISCTIQLYTGKSINDINLIYVIDADISYQDKANINSIESMPKNIELILKKTVKDKDNFLNVVKKHIRLN